MYSSVRPRRFESCRANIDPVDAFIHKSILLRLPRTVELLHASCRRPENSTSGGEANCFFFHEAGGSVRALTETR